MNASTENLGFDLIEIFSSLSEIPLVCTDEQIALKRITELGRKAMGSQACTLNYVDLANRYLTQAACSGFDDEFDKSMSGRKIKMGVLEAGVYVDFDLISKGEIVEKYHLREDGQGIANPEVARKYNLNSILSYPLKSDGQVIGYFNHFSTDSAPFTKQQKRILEIFARHAEGTIEKFHRYQFLDKSVSTLNTLSQNLLSSSGLDFLEHISNNACELFSVPICIIWKIDEEGRKLRIVATCGEVDDEYRKIELSLDDSGIKKHVEDIRPKYLSDVTKPSPKYGHSIEAAKRGWVSLLTAPMRVGDQLIGILDVFTKNTRRFKNWEHELFGTFANQAALSIQKMELLRNTHDLQRIQKQQDRDQLVAEISKAVDRMSADRQPGNPVENELDETLNVIVEKCAHAAHANTCFLRLWSRATDLLELKAFYASEQTLESPVNHTFRIGEGVAGYVAKTGTAYISDDVSTDSHYSGGFVGIELSSVLCVPIKSGGAIIGTISVGSVETKAFGPDEQALLESIVDRVSVAIERANLVDCLLRLEVATVNSESLEILLERIVEITSGLMQVPVSLIWLLDKDRNGFAVKAVKGREQYLDRLSDLLISNQPGKMWDFIQGGKALYYENASLVDDHPYCPEIRALGWKTMLAMPIVIKGRTLGVMEVYTVNHPRNFTDWHRKLFYTFVKQVSSALENIFNRERLEKLNQIMQQMAEVRDEEELLRLILKHGLNLVGSTRGTISRFDLKTGELQIIDHIGGLRNTKSLRFGAGITGHALQSGRPIRVDDINDRSWRDIYNEFWNDTRSELAVPILIDQAEVRVGRQVIFGPKPIGVLNIESPTVGAFSDADENILWSLARHAAIFIEKLQFDRKLTRLAQAERKIVGVQDWDSIIQVSLEAITDILEYEYVNFSLVDGDRNRISSKKVVGIPAHDTDDFIKMADHSLDSEDIQADVVRSREIEVPGYNDPRFDMKIFNQFRHERWLRVYIPMIVPSGEKVLGTIEAGNERRHRKHIYERDVQLLKGFIEYVVMALERRERGLLEQISHEFMTPIVGIRSNASFLQRRITELDESLVSVKFEDILADCEILKYQVRELEYILGRSSSISKLEKTLVMRDVVIKTINQLKHFIAERGFNPSSVEYETTDIHRIRLYVDRARINQVVYNILINSIKYAEDDTDSFKIRIKVDETRDDFIIKFKDWGIGIGKGYEEKVFKDGFRTSEAIRKYVTGSGLGLAIARKIMRGMKGDLKLANSYKPTEFHMILPKSLKEDPYDIVRG